MNAKYKPASKGLSVKDKQDIDSLHDETLDTSPSAEEQGLAQDKDAPVHEGYDVPFDDHALRLMDPNGRYGATLLPHIDGLGYRLIKIEQHSPKDSKGPLLQIFAEPKKKLRMGVEDCRHLSRTLSTIIDVEDLFSGAFTLEVSSPGVERALTHIRDFERFKSFRGKIQIDPPADNGQKRFSGTFIGTNIASDKSDDGQENKVEIIFVTDEKEELILDFERIASAKLVQSDELMEASKSTIL